MSKKQNLRGRAGPKRKTAKQLVGYRYEVWQDGICVASAEGPGAEREAAHYALVYGQDGPVTTRAVPIYARLPKERRP